MSLIVIVGASGDIGGAIAISALRAGHDLVLTACHSSPPADWPARHPGSPRYVIWHQLDATDVQAVASFAHEVLRTHGAPYGLIYAGGIVRDAPLLLTSVEHWQGVLAANLSAPFHLVRAFGRSMAALGAARVVLIGSLSARKAAPGQAAYAASKAGLEAFCRVAATELGRFGVTCNVVAPGAVEGRIYGKNYAHLIEPTVANTPRRRLGSPFDVAAACSYLLSDDAAFTTGQTLHVDGGWSAN